MPDAQPLFHESDAFIKDTPRAFYPTKISPQHPQLRNLISVADGDIIYYASSFNINAFCIASHRKRVITTIDFEVQCLAAGYGWICAGAGQEDGRCAFIELTDPELLVGLQHREVDDLLPLDLDPDSRLVAYRGFRPPEPRFGSLRRNPKVRYHKFPNQEIINSITMFQHVDEKTGAKDEPLAIIASNDQTVRIFSLRDQTSLQTLDFRCFMNLGRISPDGQLLICTGDLPEAFFFRRMQISPAKGSIRPGYHWRRIAEVRLSEAASDDKIFAASFSPSGHLLAVGCDRGSIHVFDPHKIQEDMEMNGALIHVIPPDRPGFENRFQQGPAMYPPGAIRSMAFSPRPWDLLAWAEDRGRVHVADVRSGFYSRQTLTLELDAMKKDQAELNKVTFDLDSSAEGGLVITTAERLLLDSTAEQRPLDTTPALDPWVERRLIVTTAERLLLGPTAEQRALDLTAEHRPLDPTVEQRALDIEATFLQRYREAQTAQDNFASISNATNYIEHAAELRRIARQERDSGQRASVHEDAPGALTDAERHQMARISLERQLEFARSDLDAGRNNTPPASNPIGIHPNTSTTDVSTPMSPERQGYIVSRLSTPPPRHLRGTTSIHQYIRDRQHSRPESRSAFSPRRRSSIVISNSNSHAQPQPDSSTSSPSTIPNSTTLAPLRSHGTSLSTSPARYSTVLLNPSSANYPSRTTTSPSPIPHPTTSSLRPAAHQSTPIDLPDTTAMEIDRLPSTASTNSSPLSDRDLDRRNLDIDTIMASVRAERARHAREAAALQATISTVTRPSSTPNQSTTPNSRTPTRTASLNPQESPPISSRRLQAQNAAAQREDRSRAERIRHSGLRAGEMGLADETLERLRGMVPLRQGTGRTGSGSMAAIRRAYVEGSGGLAGGWYGVGVVEEGWGIGSMGVGWGDGGRFLIVGTEEGIMQYTVDIGQRMMFPRQEPR